MAGKLGIGGYSTYRQAIEDIIASNATCCLLFADACAYAGEIKRRAPEMLVIGRDYRADDEQWAMLAQPEPQRYYTFFNWGRWLASAYPDVDVWQCLNETYYPGGLDRLKAVVAAEIAFTDGVSSLGKRSCVLNMATGTYPLPHDSPERAGEYILFAERVKPLLEHPGVAFLGLHAYGSPQTQMMRDDAAWFALRYREFVRGLQVCGVRVPPVIITEYGQPNGWQGFMNAEQCAADLTWFGERLNEDDYVYGATYFLDGTIDPDKWARFDILSTTVPKLLAEWNRSHPANIKTPEAKTVAKTTEQYKTLYDQWVVAGGIENNFRKHLLGIGVIKPTPADLKMLADEIAASVAQLKGALNNYPF